MKLPRLQKLLLAALGFVLVSGCAAEEIKWTEEVQTHDGQVIQLKRKTVIGVSGFPVQKRGFDRYYEFCYAPLGMHWKMQRGYRPDIFDIVDGKAYLHVPIVGCTQCQLHDYPRDNALAYVWENGAWKQVPYEQFPHFLQWNLLQHDKGDEKKYDATGLVSLAKKHEFDSGTYYVQKHQGWTRLSQAKDHVEPCGTCSRRIQTTDIPDVFLAVSDTSCDW